MHRDVTNGFFRELAMEWVDFLLTLAIGRPACHAAPGDVEAAARSGDRRMRPLLPLLHDALLRAGSAPLIRELAVARFSAEAHTRVLSAARRGLLALLSAEKVPCLVFKGSDMAEKYYVEAGLRLSGDIDLLIYARDRERVRGLLLSLDYAIRQTRPHYHTRFEKADIQFELHTDLFSYKYRVLFRLDAIQPSAILAQDRIPDELYLLISCLQFYDEMGRRLLPLADIFRILEKGVNLSDWTRLTAVTEPAFPVLFTHYWALQRFGIELFPASFLSVFGLTEARKKGLRKLAETARTKRDTYPFLLAMADRKTEKLFRLLFPPAEVRDSYDPEQKRPLFRHWKRILSELVR